MNFKKLLALAVLASALCSCNAVSLLIHDSEVVAKCGKNRLYASEVYPLIPEGAGEEESEAIIRQYATSWATRLLYADVAAAQLPKADLDIEREIEEYRAELLRFRYEKNYVEDRLDTLISEDQLEECYKSNASRFVLKSPILKVRYLSIDAQSPVRNSIQRKMMSSDYADLVEADSLARGAAQKYLDYSEQWVEASEIAAEFGVETEKMLAAYRDGKIQLSWPRTGEMKIAFVYDIRRSGPSPLEYCEPEVRELILSERRRELLSSLERDLLENARKTKNFVLYK